MDLIGRPRGPKTHNTSADLNTDYLICDMVEGLKFCEFAQDRLRVEPVTGSEGISDSEPSSDEEESDEVEALLREEQLRQKFRQRIAAARDQQYTPAVLCQFLQVEARMSSHVTGLDRVR